MTVRGMTKSTVSVLPQPRQKHVKFIVCCLVKEEPQLFRFCLFAFIEAAALRSIILRHT